ncbi:MAG: NAD(P)H-dependent oxidoreductase [Gammaproteobacteria bacterium]|nr:NAD(P)H-dependent oxidoreductase [Gammaproteobacteria bacterium]MBU2184616.1 NAD(P)H-dependent oxidoreductase [Gammaproteobacteria bacterium]MBU2205718.1 NAD(P)H-dependent oxidoreductase [Gammaproteobacteria bacterium]
MRVLAFAASNNPQSINQQLALSVARLLPQAQVVTLDIDDYELPIYSERREAELGTPAQVTAFLQQIAEADGLIVSFAEHNGGFTAAFKNLYDWASRSQRRIFQHKPAIFLAAAPGPGGAKSVLQAAVQAAPYMGAELSATVSVPNFHQVFDAQHQQIKDSALFLQLQQAALSLQQRITQDKAA